MPFGIFLGICEYHLSKVHANQIGAKKHLLEQQNHETRVLILGSSHSYYGILPAILGKPAFNLSSFSQTLYYDDALLNRCLETLPSLELVILPVSYFSMESQLDEGIERWRSYYYRYEWGIPQHDWHMAWHVRNFSAYFLCGKEVGPWNVLLGRIKDVTADFDRMGGWTNRPSGPEINKNSTVASYLQESALIALKRQQSGMKIKNIQENERILNDLARKLARKGIGLVLVTLPVSRYYGEGMDPAAYKRMQSTLNNICSNNGVSYLNHTFDRRFLDGDFWDGDHLNAAGAQKYSLLLKDEIVSRRSATKNLKLSGNGRPDQAEKAFNSLRPL